MGKAQDLTNERFGRLVVLKKAKSKGRYAMWECKCDCGNIITTASYYLIHGETKSCGCWKSDVVKKRNIENNPFPKEDLTGKKFDMLTVLSRNGSQHGNIAYLCKCECGKTVVKTSHQLRHNKNNNCGCLFKPKDKKDIGRPKKHNKIKFIDDGIEITCSNTKSKFFIDADDYARISVITWFESDQGYIHGFIHPQGKHKRIHLSRLIMGMPDKKLLVDHIDGNPKNNRKSNLRLATSGQNQINRGTRKDNKSGVTGVSFRNRDKTWIACINHNKKQYNLGEFKDINDAIQARKQAEIELYGEFSRHKGE